MVDIIETKRDGGKLTPEQIRFWIKGIVSGEIPDYQSSALTMAILLKGMDEEETSVLTDEMTHSGETIDLSKIEGKKVDKHSTGGVGDKTSLVLGPLVAACGGKLAKMSGRGLGHTGGTLDKLESIPGMNVYLSKEAFIKQVNEIGLAIAGQTSSIDPADKKLYALRDVTATVESLPLIASSIMSKKLASGSDCILLDVKFGSGAFMKTKEKAEELAKAMVKIGKSLGRDTRAILTDMDQPLGKAVGNALEVKEAIATLNGEGPEDLTSLCVKAGGIMLCQAGLVSSETEGEKRIKEAIDNRSGLAKLADMIKAQGGDSSYIHDPSLFPNASFSYPIYAKKEGYVERIDSLAIGLAAMKLGAGRETMEDKIDMSAGIIINKKVGEKVKEGELLATAYTNKEGVENILLEIENAFSLSVSSVSKGEIVYSYIV